MKSDSKRRTNPRHKVKNSESALSDQLEAIAHGLAQTFFPFCEVVVHDLTHPKHAIISIENNLSNRNVGDPATELGLARIEDPTYPQILANYANRFSDGRRAKSTSIGIRNEKGQYVAALCVNVDLTLFEGFQGMLTKFSSTTKPLVSESLDTSNADRIRQRIDEFSASRATTSRLLTSKDRKKLIKELKTGGYLEVRRGAELVADHLGISRATVYNDAK